jgi:hypothetical protein
MSVWHGMAGQGVACDETKNFKIEKKKYNSILFREKYFFLHLYTISPVFT